MRFRSGVSSGIKQPEIETNGGLIYVRSNYASHIEKDEGGAERVVWTYDEYVLTANEYNDVRVGRFIGEWSDALRSVQRESLYEQADRMLMKYSSDVQDSAKRQAWITYKAGVRATQNAPGYPQTVNYPAVPE